MIFDLKTKQIYHETPIKYLCVYDLECNCSKNKEDIAFNEIVEFPVIVVDLEKMEVVA